MKHFSRCDFLKESFIANLLAAFTSLLVHLIRTVYFMDSLDAICLVLYEIFNSKLDCLLMLSCLHANTDPALLANRDPRNAEA